MRSDRVFSVLNGALVALAAVSLLVSIPRFGMFTFAVFVVSFFLGTAVTRGVTRIRGKRVRVPIVHRSRATMAALVIVMLSLALVSVFQVQRFVDREEDCNRQFRSALLYNAEINSETRVLDDKEDAQLDRRRAALDRLVDDLSVSSDPRIGSVESQMRSNIALQSYKAVVGDVAGELSKIKRDRIAATERRAPYPQPRCGEAQ